MWFLFMEQTHNGGDGRRVVSRHIAGKLLQFCHEGPFCDVIIRTVDGAEFRAHRVILATNNYFDRLFPDDNPQPFGSNVIYPDVTGEVLPSILDYLYTNKCELFLNNVNKVLSAAFRLCISDLTDECIKFIENNLTSTNCLDYYRFARELECRRLEGITHRFAVLRFPEVQGCAQFKELDANLVCCLLDDDALNIKREDMVFVSILRWMRHDLSERNVFLSLLLNCVRFGLTSHSFINHVCNHPLIQDDPNVHSLLFDPRFLMLEDDAQSSSDALQLVGNDVTLPPHATVFDAAYKTTRPRQPTDVLFAIGGWSGGSPIGSIETYDARTNRWFPALDTNGRPAAYHGLEVVDGRIYMVGGFDGADGQFNAVRCFQPSDRSWSERACMYSRRCYVSTCVLDGQIYALGGSDGRQRLRTAERFDPATNQWHRLADMRASRSDAAAVSAAGRVFIAGGFNGMHVLDSVEVYDPTDDSWTFAHAMTSARSGVSLVHLDGTLYALGGFDGERRLSSGEKLVLGGHEAWQPIASMSTTRSNFACCVLEREVVVMGGFDGSTTITAVESYSPSHNRWTQLADMHVHRSALAACVVVRLDNSRHFSYLGHGEQTGQPGDSDDE